MENMEMIRKTLMVSIFEVFEKMFYIFLEPIEKKDVDCGMNASIYYKGPAEGVINATFSSQLAHSMVRNMLNMGEEEITDKLIADCLKESVNMIGGNFLRKLAPSQVFDLSIPELAEISTGPGEYFSMPLSNRLEMNFESGEGALGVVLHFSPIAAEL